MLYGPDCHVTAVALRETTGAAVATARLRDGGDASGQMGIPYTLAANESVRDGFPGGGFPFRGGVYLEVVAGTVEGSIVVAFPVEYEVG